MGSTVAICWRNHNNSHHWCLSQWRANWGAYNWCLSLIVFACHLVFLKLLWWFNWITFERHPSKSICSESLCRQKNSEKREWRQCSPDSSNWHFCAFYADEAWELMKVWRFICQTHHHQHNATPECQWVYSKRKTCKQWHWQQQQYFSQHHQICPSRLLMPAQHQH